jgi:hypothetical protein
MKKVSAVAARQSRNFSEQKLTVGLDPGDRSSRVSSPQLGPNFSAGKQDKRP